MCDMVIYIENMVIYIEKNLGIRINELSLCTLISSLMGRGGSSNSNNTSADTHLLIFNFFFFLVSLLEM